MNDLLTAALASYEESERVEFKEAFDVTSKGAWYEILKDIVAMANSGGGVLLIGVNDDGQPSGADVMDVLNYDPADVTNKMFASTSRHFSNFRITKAQKDGYTVAAIEIGIASIPLVFTTSGSYQGPDGKQKSAFALGTVYFRHGAKSSPGTSDDLAQFLKREIDLVKNSWLSGIRKVVEAPEGSQIIVLPAEAAADTRPSSAQVVRITDDPNAPAVTIREDDSLKDTYDYKGLTKILKERYIDFIENPTYHKIRKSLEDKPAYCTVRLLNPKNPRSSKTRFYRPAILEEFDKHYTKK